MLNGGSHGPLRREEVESLRDDEEPDAHRQEREDTSRSHELAEEDGHHDEAYDAVTDEDQVIEIAG